MDGKTAGKNECNGTYSGMLGLIQSQVADIMYVPMGITVPSEFAKASSYSGPSKYSILSRPEVSVKEQSILTALNVFPSNVVHCSIATGLLILVALGLMRMKTFRNSEPRLVRHFVMVFSCLLRQVNTCWTHVDTWGKVLTILVLFWSLFLTTVFMNLINAGMVPKNYTGIVDSVEDFIRLKHLKPTFAEDTEYEDYFKRHRNVRIRSIYNRPGKRSVNANLETLYKGLQKDEVYFADEFTAMFFARITCDKCKHLRPNVVWLARKGGLTTSTYFVLNANANANFQLEMDRRSQQLAESDIIYATHLLSATSAQKMVDTSDNCFRNDLDGLFDEETTLIKRLTFKQYEKVIRIVTSAYAFASFILLIEIAFGCLKFVICWFAFGSISK